MWTLWFFLKALQFSLLQCKWHFIYCNNITKCFHIQTNIRWINRFIKLCARHFWYFLCCHPQHCTQYAFNWFSVLDFGRFLCQSLTFCQHLLTMNQLKCEQIRNEIPNSNCNSINEFNLPNGYDENANLIRSTVKLKKLFWSLLVRKSDDIVRNTVCVLMSRDGFSWEK